MLTVDSRRGGSTCNPIPSGWRAASTRTSTPTLRRRCTPILRDCDRQGRNLRQFIAQGRTPLARPAGSLRFRLNGDGRASGFTSTARATGTTCAWITRVRIGIRLNARQPIRAAIPIRGTVGRSYQPQAGAQVKVVVLAIDVSGYGRRALPILRSGRMRPGRVCEERS